MDLFGQERSVTQGNLILDHLAAATGSGPVTWISTSWMIASLPLPR